MQAIKKRWLGAGTGRRDREERKRGTKKKRATVRIEKRATVRMKTEPMVSSHSHSVGTIQLSD